MPGTTFTGRYRIVALLGRGGMGEVYRADDLKLGQCVALKFLPAELAGDADRLARFLNEVRVARQVSHPYVCRVYDIGEADGQPFLTMEYIDGEDLGSLLRQVGRLPEDRGVELTRQLCLGLAAAHGKGVIHRDLKPRNIMIDARGHVRITDFGLAGLAGSFQGMDIRAGTPAYQAPEQTAGKEVTYKSDIYALGLVAYEMFTGKKAFPAASYAELARSHAEESPATPSSHVRDLNPAVERVILRCLEKDPALRPSSAREVAVALPGSGLLDVIREAAETPSPEDVAREKVKAALVPQVALALLLMTLAGLVLSAWLADRVAVFRQLRQDLSPRELSQKAQIILGQAGYADFADSAWGLATDHPLLKYLARTGVTVKHGGGWESGHPDVLYYWYRQGSEWVFRL
jgi:serine/threonine-protein kinase